MSWHCSRAAVEAFSEVSSSGIESLEPSRSTSTQDESLCNVKTTATSSPSLSGTTFEPLMDDHGVATWTSSQAASPAKTSLQPQEKELESRALDLACGRKWPALSAKFDPDSSSWKTRQSLFQEVLPWSSVILPKWGLMLSGDVYALEISGLPILETEFGSLPTPVAQHRGLNWKRAQEGKKTNKGRTQKLSNYHEVLPRYWLKAGNKLDRALRLNPDFQDWLMGFPTSWTESGALETHKFQQWQRSLGPCSVRLDSGN